MFGAHAFGALYFGGAPRTTTAPVVVSGQVGGGFFPFPMVQRRKIVDGAVRCELAPAVCRGRTEVLHPVVGVAACAFAPVMVQCAGINVSHEARLVQWTFEIELMNIAISLVDEG
jgi:hypothetical protein